MYINKAIYLVVYRLITDLVGYRLEGVSPLVTDVALGHVSVTRCPLSDNN